MAMEKVTLGFGGTLAGLGATGLTAMVASKLRRGGAVNTRAVVVQAATAALSAGYAALGASRLGEARA